MADALKRELGLDAQMVIGDLGEFTVWVKGRKVAEKEGGAFPTDQKVVAAARGVLQK